MTLYADPSRCPDCRGPLPAGAPTCPTCGLVLTGPLGQRLFEVLTEADSLLARMRTTASTPVTAPATTPATAHGEAAPPLPTALPMPPPGPARGLSAASVPKILLGLGALCLLVAALVFLAVSWTRLGVGGRTAVLVALTAAAAALSAFGARRDLRGVSESLGVVALGLFTLDLFGARDAGWVGAPSDATFWTLLGLVLFAVATLAVQSTRSTPVEGFTGGEVVAVLGAAAAGLGVSAGNWSEPSWRLVAATVLVGVMAVAVTALREAQGGGVPLRKAAHGLVGVTVLFWVTTCAASFAELGPEPTWRSLYLVGDGWPALAAMALAFAVAAAAVLPLAARVWAAAAGLGVAGALVVTPASDTSVTALSVAMLLLALFASAAFRATPTPWRYALLAPLAVGLSVPAAQTLELLSRALGTFLATGAELWEGTPDGRVEPLTTSALGEPWVATATLLLVVALLVVPGPSLFGGPAAPGAGDAEARPGGLRIEELAVVRSAAAAVAAVLAALVPLLLYPVPVLLVTAALAAATVAGAAYALRRDDPVALAVTAATGAATLWVGLYDEVPSLLAAAAVLGSAGALHLRGRRPVAVEVTGGVAAAALAWAGWSWGAQVVEAGPDRTWLALVVLVVLAVLVPARGGRPNLVGRGGRGGVELGSAAAMLAVAAGGLEVATAATAESWLAVYLTVAGASASALAVLREDRRLVGWLGGVLLAMATWVRLADLGVDEPEAYTLPSAVALLAVGLWRLRTQPGSSTVRLLGPGLTLALTPSLLWMWGDAASLRALLLGLGCLALVVAGLQLRWSAPLVWGATVGALVVLREVGPYFGDNVPRWAVLGVAGVLLVALGVTWEQRVREARLAASYVRRLR